MGTNCDGNESHRLRCFAIGNHEFDDGPAGLAPFLRSINFPVVSANIDATGTMLDGLFKPYQIAEIEGERVAIIGYTLQETEFTSNTSGLRLNPEIPTLQDQVKKLQADGINKFIALGHSGIVMDRRICQEVPGIDIVSEVIKIRFCCCFYFIV